MSGNLEVKIDTAQYNHVIRMLEKMEGKSEEAVYRKAANETAKKARKALIKQAKKTYAGGKATEGTPVPAGPQGIEQRSSIRKGTATHANATISFRSAQPDIMKHGYKAGMIPTKTAYRNGKRMKFPIYVRQLKGKYKRAKDKNGKLAFAVKFKSGHIGIVNRTGETTKNGKERLKTWMGSSDKAMVSNEKVYGQEESKIMQTLVDECNKALWKAMGGKK